MKKTRLMLIVATVLTLAFIFGQSLLCPEISSKESTAVKKQVVDPVYKSVTHKDTFPYNVRDMAHTVEFAVLGLEVILLLNNKRMILRTVNAVGCCGLVALIDEGIQHFSGRAPQFTDVLHDILGAVIGTLSGMVLLLIVGRFKAKPKQRT